VLVGHWKQQEEIGANEKEVEREDSDCAPKVEIPEIPLLSPRGKQYSGDQVTGQNEEKIDANPSQAQPIAKWPRKDVPKMANEDESDRNAPYSIQFGNVAKRARLL
jgi:hypothetical protein